jgi:DNA-binding protein HU-beta
MGRNDIITSMSEKTGLTKVDCEKAIDAFAESITESLADGDKVLLKGFMSFEVIERAARRGRNPKTGEVSTFPATKSVKCKVSQAIKDAVNEK